MVTNQDEEDPGPTTSDRVRASVAEAWVNTQAATRLAVAGHPKGAIRRIILYGIAVGMFAFAAPLAAIIGTVCVVLLIATDDLR